MKYLSIILIVLSINIFSQTQIKENQIKDNAITRNKLNADSTGKAVIKRLFAVSPLSVTSSGVDTGTGDVTIEIDSTEYLKIDSITATNNYIPKISTDKKLVNSSIKDSSNLIDFDSDIRITRNGSFISARAGRIYKASDLGLVYHGVTGTTANITWVTPSGTRVLENPAGTNNIVMGTTGAVRLGVGKYPSSRVDISGSFKTDSVFISTIATGTAPLQVTSSTKVDSLNADKVDGYNFNQSLLTTDSPTFSNLTITNNINLATTKFIYLCGNETTDGSWRIGATTSGNLLIEYRISGSWVAKQTLTP